MGGGPGSCRWSSLRPGRIALVASPVAEFMTGATIDVNSGRFLP
jgi:hypothetical protein